LDPRSSVLSPKSKTPLAFVFSKIEAIDGISKVKVLREGSMPISPVLADFT
jgi:hypothetical protein